MAMGARYPTADQVAAGLVEAARETGELATLAATPRRVIYAGMHPPLRASWATLEALDAAYPHADLLKLAKWAGLPGRTQSELRFGLRIHGVDGYSGVRIFCRVAS